MIVYTLIILLCSFLYGASAVFCKYGLQYDTDVKKISIKNVIPVLIRNKMWVLGVIISFSANIIIIEVQSYIDISVVYPMLNFSYVFTLLLGYLVLKEDLNKNQFIGIMLVVTGTLVIIFLKDPVTGDNTNILRLLFLNLSSMIAVALIVTTVYLKKIENYELYFAICTGILFGNVETYVRASTNMVTDQLGYFTVFSFESLAYLVTAWPFLVLVVFGAVGWVCMQITYSHGDVSITVPLFAVIQSVITISSGYYIFGESFGLSKLLGIFAIIMGVMVLILSTRLKQMAVAAN